MAQYLDEITGTYVSAEEHFGYQTEHDIRNQASEYSFIAFLGLECDPEDLTEDAKEAYDAWYGESTELDYENGERYWLDVNDTKLFEKYAPRIWDEDGNPRVA
jgi:hypothetical protein